jgi:hypothetical protein
MLQRLKASLPAMEVVEAGLQPPRFPRLRLDRFPRGIDKAHIDVALGPALVRACSLYSSALVRETAQQLWRQPVSNAAEALVASFRDLLRDDARSVVKQARGPDGIERVQLFQLAVLKLSLGAVDEALAGLRHELDDARGVGARERNAKSLQFHEQAVILGRHAGHLRYRVAREVTRQLMRVEQGGLRNLRHSVLGVSWPVAEEMLDNPILQLDGVGGLRDFYRNYPALLHDLEHARAVGSCLFGAMAGWLPADVGAPPAKRSTAQRLEHAQAGPARGSSRGLLDAGRWLRCLVPEADAHEGAASWLDQPENVVALLGGDDAAWPQAGPWRSTRVEPLQRELNRRFIARLGKAGLWRRVEASYALAEIYPTLGLTDAEPQVLGFLCGDFGRRELVRRLGTPGGADPAALARRIEAARKEYVARPRAGRAQLAARLAGDFLRLRRDLMLAVRVFAAMDGIRLLADPRDLDLSRRNNVLQVLCPDEFDDDRRGSVTGHVIMKVEIRGSTTLTAEMRRRDLNPAAYFSRHFFDPVERARKRFDAYKIAVDGDSLMLTIAEYGGDGSERLAVARACCLASQLLKMVGAMNAESERLGLPRLELGLGIAYADEAPTYLYDQSRRVVVSPAIERARRLSSCHLPLRASCPLPGGHGLCVASPVSGQPGDEEQEDGLVRYNVNGIELDAAAFSQLNVELALHRLRVRERKGRRPSRLYVGRCPDVGGEMHWVVIREQVVKLWMGRQLLEAEDEGRSYFEVLTDPRVVERVLQQLRQAPPGEGQTADATRL